jgi:hypothetical protein
MASFFFLFGCNLLVSKDLLGKAWGWDRLLPLAGVSRSDYSKYIEEYFRRNARELVPGAAAALAEIVK